MSGLNQFAKQFEVRNLRNTFDSDLNGTEILIATVFHYINYTFNFV